MKKTFAFITMIAFVGVSAFSLNTMDKEGTRTAENKTECATAVAEKASGCSSTSSAVLTSGTEKASDCGSADKAVKTAAAEKASGCGSTCGSAASTQTAASGDCSTEKSEDERVAEIQ